MINLTSPDGGTVYESAMDYYFAEFFALRGVDILTEYKEQPNAVMRAGLRYVFNKCFRLPEGALIAGNLNSYITTDYNDLKRVTLWYLEAVEKYNIVSFIESYCVLIGITSDCFQDWNRYDVKKGYELYSNYYYNQDVVLYTMYNSNDNEYMDVLRSLKKDILQIIRGLGASSVRSKLSDDKTGIIVLANNDAQVGLEYEQKRTVDRIEATARTVAELPNLFGVGGQLPNKSE